MSHEETIEVSPQSEPTFERAMQLVQMEDDAFVTAGFEHPEQKKWADGFSSISRMLAIATTLPPTALDADTAPSAAV